MNNDYTALLPTRTRINPTTQEGEYASPGQGYEITEYVHESGLPVVLTTFGEPAPLGTIIEARHDQSLGFLGRLKVIGRVSPDGRQEGTVPDRKLPHWVYK